MQLKEAFEKAVREAKETSELIDLVSQVIFGKSAKENTDYGDNTAKKSI